MADQKLSIFDFDSAKKPTTNNTSKAQSSSLGDKHLDSLLTSLWEKDTDMPTTIPSNMSSRKRKASGASDVDSTEKLDMDSVGGGQQKARGKVGEKNVLLAKLLSRQTPNEPRVNTRHSVNPCDMPQNKLPPNLQEKILRLQPLDPQSISISKSEEKDASKRDSLQDISLPNNSVNMNDVSKEAFRNLHSGGTTNILNQSLSAGGSMSLNNSMSGESYLPQPQPSPVGGVTSSANMFTNDNSLQSMLGQSNDSGMEMDQANSDQLLANILQQAAELQQDITTGNVGPSAANQNTGKANNQGNVTDATQWLSQLEQVISENNFQINDIESLINTNQPTQPLVEDRAAIEAIQKQLMSEEPLPGSTGMMEGGMRASGGTMGRMQQQQQQPMRQNSFQGMGAQGLGQMAGGMNVSIPPMSPHPQQPSPSPQGFNQAAPNFSPQGPRLSGPPGEICL